MILTSIDAAAELTVGDVISLPLKVDAKKLRAALLACGLDYSAGRDNTLQVVQTQFAVVDASGRGPKGPVYHAAASKSECLGWAKRGGCRVVEMTGAIKGDQVWSHDIGRIYPEVAS